MQVTHQPTENLPADPTSEGRRVDVATFAEDRNESGRGVGADENRRRPCRSAPDPVGEKEQQREDQKQVRQRPGSGDTGERDCLRDAGSDERTGGGRA